MIVFEDILQNVGGSGKYQYMQCVPLVMVLPLMSWHLLGGAFLFALPEKRCSLETIVPSECHILPNTDLSNFSTGEYDEILRYLFITDISEKKSANCKFKKFATDKKEVKWDSICSEISRFENRSLFTFAENGSMVLEAEMAAKVNGLAIPDQFEEVPCHSWEYSDKYYTDTGLTEFGWVCDQANYQQLMQIAVMIGVFWGSPLFGWTSDTYGRKPTMVGCITLCLGSMGVLRFSRTVWHFFFLRMLDGAGAIGAIAAAFVLISEVFESVGYQKILVLQIAQALFGVSQAVLAVLAAKVRGWRDLSTVIAAPCLLVAAVFFVNNESARWLIAQNRYDEANHILRRTAKMNGKTVKEQYVTRETALLDESKLNEADETKSSDDEPKENFWAALKRRPLNFTILNLAYQWFMLSGLYYTLAIKAVEFGENPFVNFAISGLLEAPACFGTLLMYQFLGRRPSTFYMEVVAGVSLMALLVVPDSYKSVFAIFPQIGKFALAAAYGGIYIYSAEIFPTTIKNFGIGVCSSIARIAGVISQFIEMIPNSRFCVENEELNCKKIPYVIYGVLTIVGCLLMFFLPETNGQTSPENIEEGAHFAEGQQSLLTQIVTCNKTAKQPRSGDLSVEHEKLSTAQDSDTETHL